MWQKAPEIRKKQDGNAVNRAIRKLRMCNLGWDLKDELCKKACEKLKEHRQNGRCKGPEVGKSLVH